MATPKYFPICCTADIPAKVIQSFLEQTYEHALATARQYDSNASPEDVKNMVVVRKLTDTLTSATLPPVRTAVSRSPFKNKSVEECRSILESLYQDTDSEIYTGDFVILDERSVTDATVLVVSDEGGDDDEEMEDDEDVEVDDADQPEDNEDVDVEEPNLDPPDEDENVNEEDEEGVDAGESDAEDLDEDPEAGGLQTVRTAFASALDLIMILNIGTLNVFDARRTADEGDGVYRD